MFHRNLRSRRQSSSYFFDVMHCIVFPRDVCWCEYNLVDGSTTFSYARQGSMPTDGTLLLEHMPKGKQYLVTALSVFFSVGSVLSAIVGIIVIPRNSCPTRTPTIPPCDVETMNKGWKYLLLTIALIVRHPCSLGLPRRAYPT